MLVNFRDRQVDRGCPMAWVEKRYFQRSRDVYTGALSKQSDALGKEEIGAPTPLPTVCAMREQQKTKQ